MKVGKVLEGNSDLIMMVGLKEGIWFIVGWVVLGLVIFVLKDRIVKLKEESDLQGYLTAI